MWQLKNISAQNICAFKNMSYSPLQGCTTLIFGNNLDNDSQGSNGSGKSALIEAFAIALTGETLRRIYIEEIINDACDDAQIQCLLVNSNTHDTLEIVRSFSRNSTQSIALLFNGEEIVMPSIAEYNRYVLDILGVTKDDIFSSYILSKHKYTSFLNASDRVKKELINRFSNGSLVDESIEHLKADIQQAKEDVLESEKRVAHTEGCISSIDEQITVYRSEEDERTRKRDELIDAHKEAIAKLHGEIRSLNETIAADNEKLSRIQEIDDMFSALEDGSEDVIACYNKIKETLKATGLTGWSLKDYPAYSKKLYEDLARYESNVSTTLANIEACSKNIAEAVANYETLRSQYETMQAGSVPAMLKLKAEIAETNNLIASLVEENHRIVDESAELHKTIAQLQGMLAGVIECPACHHQFILDTDLSVKEINRRLASATKRLNSNDKAEKKNSQQIAEARDTLKASQDKQNNIDEELSALSTNVREANTAANNLRENLNNLQASLSSDRYQVSRINDQIISLRRNLFDQTFDIIDAEVRQIKTVIGKIESSIVGAKNKIETYTSMMNDLQNVSVPDTIEQLEGRKGLYEKELQRITEILNADSAKLSVLNQQEARFIDFKTHLANSKIEALAALTNEFLEAIGSDIRIVFSGYTVLKSGKIRDKISISLQRDGIDCGSFAKFSAGEQCRVNLASILALHKLTNVNCDDDKGLDLLILDEILDATDESGLANMFEALNTLQITSMVVSHGQIAEAYPYRLTVTKQNGISTINEIEL